jgi:hypothetical protein
MCAVLPAIKFSFPQKCRLNRVRSSPAKTVFNYQISMDISTGFSRDAPLNLTDAGKKESLFGRGRHITRSEKMVNLRGGPGERNSPSLTLTPNRFTYFLT